MYARTDRAGPGHGRPRRLVVRLTDQLVDEDLVVIASTIGDAGEAMAELGWFGGDDDGETWIVWSQVPHLPAGRAAAVRAWLQANRPELVVAG